jgi:hypothetical protein
MQNGAGPEIADRLDPRQTADNTAWCEHAVVGNLRSESMTYS